MSDLVRHLHCFTCGKPFERERFRGRPPNTCGTTWCVGIDRYRTRYGRWPPECWLAWFAVEKGLLRLPARLRRPRPHSASAEARDPASPAQAGEP